MKYTRLATILLFTILSSCLHRHRSCITSKYPEGAIFTIICYDKEGRRHGSYQEFGENDVLTIKCDFIRDSLNGTYLEYHFNGQLRYRLNYEMNRLMQIESAFDEEGQPLIMGDLINGNGLVSVYYRDGKLRSYGVYSNGLKHGYWKIVSNAGVADSVEFIDGLRLSTGRYEFVP